MISQGTDHCVQELALGVFCLYVFFVCMSICLETDSVSMSNEKYSPVKTVL